MGTTLEFVASSLRDLKAMPDTVQDVFGFALDLAERGMKHPNAKPMSGYTKDGVFEVAINGKNAYRTMYATKIGKKIYVLHCFQKKSVKGIATPQTEIDTLNSRIKAAHALAKEEENAEEK